MTFKSERAARAAVTRLTRAYEAARDARLDAERDRLREEPTTAERARLDALEAQFTADPSERREGGAFSAWCALWDEVNDRPVAAARAAEDTAWEAMRAAREGARAQGYSTPCYPLDHNPTRELIALNID